MSVLKNQPTINIPGFGRVGVITLAISAVVVYFTIKLLSRQVKRDINTPPPPPPPAPTGAFSGDKFAAAFNANFWKQYAGHQRLISDTEAQNAAKSLRDAVWGPGTDEDRIRIVLLRLPNIISVSRVADAYQRLYREPLLSALEDDLTLEEMQTYVAGVIIDKPWV